MDLLLGARVRTESRLFTGQSKEFFASLVGLHSKALTYMGLEGIKISTHWWLFNRFIYRFLSKKKEFVTNSDIILVLTRTTITLGPPLVLQGNLSLNARFRLGPTNLVGKGDGNVDILGWLKLFGVSSHSSPLNS